MENDNLDKFFKDRLSDFESSNDGWDRLGKAPFDNAKNQFPSHRKRIPWLPILFSAIGIGLIYFVFCLNKQVEVLEKKYEVDQNNWAKEKLDLENANKELAIKLVTINERAQQPSSQGQINGIERNQLLGKIDEQKNYIARLINKQEYLEAMLVSCRNDMAELISTEGETEIPSIDDLEKRTTSSVSEIAAFKLKVALTRQDYIPMMSPEKIDLKLIEKSYNNYEVGMDFGVTEVQTPILRSFDGQEIIVNNENIRPVSFESIGFHFNYYLSENWWIGTGFRYADIHIEDNFSSGLAYDSSGEIVNANGDRSNEFKINTESPIVKLNATTTVDIPSSLRLETGDLLEFSISDFQDLSYVQIPLYLGYKWNTQNRFQWDTYMGFHWNHLTIENYSIDLFASADGISIPSTTKIDIDANNQFARKYFGLAFGVGITYNFSNRWNIRLKFEGTENFINVENDQMNLTGMGGSLATFGINYKF